MEIMGKWHWADRTRNEKGQKAASEETYLPTAVLLTRAHDFPADWEFPSITLYHLQQRVD